MKNIALIFTIIVALVIGGFICWMTRGGTKTILSDGSLSRAEALEQIKKFDGTKITYWQTERQTELAHVVIDRVTGIERTSESRARVEFEYHVEMTDERAPYFMPVECVPSGLPPGFIPIQHCGDKHDEHNASPLRILYAEIRSLRALNGGENAHWTPENHRDIDLALPANLQWWNGHKIQDEVIFIKFDDGWRLGQ